MRDFTSMSDPGQKDDNHSNEENIPPTASFGDSVPVPGSKIGSFHIERELGRGAMGVVYLAHDTKLDRQVAIKSISAGVLNNPTARMRFSREARVLASLNHPGIAAIYDELRFSEETGYLVLEFIPGQTLAERLEVGRLSLREVLRIAGQIAEAVAAAHDRDVIHRDLKPGNIKITPEDKVKVLDFGLAKSVGSESPEQLSTVTEPGRVIGTPVYMSPEQACGKPTDKRTDIWAFGCMLFEMLTGKVPFEGETSSDTLAKVLQGEPDWNALPKNTPTNIRILLRRCLEKDPHRRLRDIGDAAIEINETLAIPSNTLSGGDSSLHDSWTRTALRIAIGIVVGSVLMLLFLKARTNTSVTERTFNKAFENPTLVRRYCVDLDPDNPLIASGGRGTPAPSFTSDGRHMVYTAGADGNTWVAVRSLDRLDVRRIRGTDGAIWAAPSPDGQWLVFVTLMDTWRVPFTGGSPERLGVAMSFVWENENTLICRPNNDITHMYRLDMKTKQLQKLNQPPKRDNTIMPQPIQFESQGKTLFCTLLGARIEDSAVFALSIDTGEYKLIVEHAWAAWYVPSGHLVYTQSGRMMAAPFKLATLEFTGTAVDITEERMATDKSVPSFNFSPDGTLVYVPIRESNDLNRVLVWVDLEGNETPLQTRQMPYRSISISHDSTRPQVVGDTSSEGDIWIYDTAGESPIRPLTFLSDGTCISPIWVPPANSEVIFGAGSVETGYVLKRKTADGSKQASELLSLALSAKEWSFMLPAAFDPNGKVLLAAAAGSIQTSKRMDIVALDTGSDVKVRTLLASEGNEHSPAISPDGNWLAYVSDESGRDEVYVTTFPNVESKWRLSVETEGGRSPVWAPDGTAIYYRDGTSILEVPVDTKDGFKYGRVERLFDDVYLSSLYGHDYDIHPSGKKFLMVKKSPDDVAPTELIVVENWFEELKRLVPREKDL